MKQINASFQTSNAATDRRRACAATPTPVFRCFLWLDLILPWIILIWMMIRYL